MVRIFYPVGFEGNTNHLNCIVCKKESKLKKRITNSQTQTGRGGVKMSKKKNKEIRNNPAMPTTDVEFAQDGLERVALKAQEKKKK